MEKKVKNLEPIFRILPSVMIDRSDAQVYFKQDIPLSNMDEYIDKKAQDGIRMSYMNIIYAGIVRIINERPKLNRFVMNGTTYQRDTIYVSLSIKKSLTDDGQETVVKITFKGTETILEIKEKVNAAIDNNKDVQTANKTDNLVKILNLVPNFLILFSVKMLKFLDKHGIMPKAVIKASPFHTSVFLTNVGSLGIDSIYHHIYNFGTTSLFFSMGKKKKSYIYEEDEIKEDVLSTINFVKNMEKYKEIGCELPSGILLEGSPGTGKTLLAKSIASESNMNFKSIVASDFLDKYVGESSKRVQEVFDNLNNKGGGLLFIDEIDAIGINREGDDNKEYRSAMNKLLSCMNDASENSIIVIGATNLVEQLDPALIREGRFASMRLRLLRDW